MLVEGAAPHAPSAEAEKEARGGEGGYMPRMDSSRKRAPVRGAALEKWDRARERRSTRQWNTCILGATKCRTRRILGTLLVFF